MSRWIAAWALWSSLLSLCVPWGVAAQTASGSPGSPVQLDVDNSCEDIIATVTKVVALELHCQVNRVAVGAAPATSATQVRLRCASDSATLAVYEPGTASPLTLHLDLGPAPPSARPRLLALALSELIVSARMGGVGPESEPEARPQEPSREPQPGAQQQVWLGPGLVWSVASKRLAPSFHAGARLRSGALAGLLDLRGDLIQHGQASATVGGFAMSALIAPALVANLGEFELLGGIGLRLGYVRLSGDSDDAALVSRTLSGWLLDPAVHLALAMALSQRVGLRAAVEAAYVGKPIRGLDADGRALYQTAGVSLGANLGLVLFL